MSQLVETIKLKEGILQNIQFHNIRFYNTRKELFNISEYIRLEDIIYQNSPPTAGIYKVRVLYDKQIHKIEFIKYKLPNINKLILINDEKIEYKYKFVDRTQFEVLKNNIGQNTEVIICQKGYITDTTFTNVAFYDGKKWFTPNTYLLKGTKREYYLENKIIYEEEIKIKDLKKFKKVALINAMIDLCELVLPIEAIENLTSI
ncbi:4-amino-4-deoxychorismate lyase [Deferribacter desulfuricans SSM1]|uniref:4-amino-4-deoxychorismate lyase n=1 Tax=Deferribacter desulfuricans (strain DSM 14783 / JCM 11476 / NBRC 101012 / SSM1) TaxID=639282 RepID=D3PDU9_DEFDS|nr:aminotransferase class IV [Deferribacter desulfuricans]BAI80772.1 4-amino-4-deoxychorismate lyase [Deferribacter desulfuricans SSM1]